MKMLKRLLVRFGRHFNNDSAIKISREERYLMRIVNKLLNTPESDPLMTPGMNKIYIRSGDETIFVVIDFNSCVASVINHHFGYDIKISNRVANYIGDRFSAEVETRRKNMEDTYRGNIQYSLSNVLNNLCPKTETDEA